MPSSKKAREGMLALIPPKDQIIFELGSGWGHLAFSLSRHLPNATIHAFETSPFPWFVSLIANAFLRRANLKIMRRNFYKISFKEADCLVCYLYPGAMKKLKKKIEKELRPGALVITNTFSIPGWTPYKVFKANDFYKSHLYCYRM